MSDGWSFPVEISADNGQVEISAENRNIRESVRIILLTEPGERLLHPEFGTGLRRFLFENMDSQTEEMIKREVRLSLYRFEKRITDISVTVNAGRIEEGILYVRVAYRIRRNREQDSVEVGYGGP